MANLLKETIYDLKAAGKTPKDVKWVGSKDFWFSWNDFEKLADTKYDEGFGAPEVAQDLLIVGDDWWMEREEYDGSEGWSFKQLPLMPKHTLKPTSLTVHQTENASCGWESLRSLNKYSEQK